jgi:hypothetical protein
MTEGFYHNVREGDCISSIAQENGFFWETLWNHSNNADLRQLRQDPNVLFPDDKVFVPALSEKTEDCATEKLHRFRRKGVPAKARFRFLDEQGQPRANVKYDLDIDGDTSQGKTDAEGYIEISIPPNAQEGTITLHPDDQDDQNDQDEIYTFFLGGMDPVSEKAGACKRLNNLGYQCDIDNTEQFVKALKEFQLNHDLEVTGELDEPTQKALLEEHGC